MAFSSKTLTYIYHATYIIIFKAITKQTYHIQTRSKGMLSMLNKQVITFMAKHSQILFMFIKARSRSYLKQMHVHANARFTSLLTTPQHLCINTWSYHMHVHGISKKGEKNPNLTCEGQTTNKHGR